MLNSKKEYFLKLISLIIASFSPIICWISAGPMPSFSSYWLTDAQPLFIISNLLTVYYFSFIPNWRIPATFLILLTCFSVEKYQIFHNALAILFFISSAFVIFKGKRYSSILFIYIPGLLFLCTNIFIAEVVFIESLCVYHLLILNKLKSIKEL